MATRKSTAKTAGAGSPAKKPKRTAQEAGAATRKTATRKTATRKSAAAPASATSVTATASKTARKAAAPKRAEATMSDAEARYRAIAEAAYLRAERRGFAVGYELEDWLHAEAEYNIRKEAS